MSNCGCGGEEPMQRKRERQSNSYFEQNLSKWRTKGSIDLVVNSGTRVTDSNAEPFDHGGRN